MPLLFTRHPFPGATLGVWQILEEEDFFRVDLPLSAAEEAEFALHKGVRRLEWLAGRWLLHKLTGAPQRIPLAKDAFSKPFFPENQQLACSLSHSRGLVGALLIEQPGDAEFHNAYGFDIQLFVPKMTALAQKFLSEPERMFVDQYDPARQFELLHLFWTAKESLYKAYGLKQLDFRGHIHVADFPWDGQSGTAHAMIKKGLYEQRFKLWFERFDLSQEEDNQAFIWTVCAAHQED
jgi:4'-phosphopantetheinyl transferase